MQLVQVCHHVSHLPFQWPRTGKSYAGKSPRSLFQEGPLMLHVERADGICSKPQLDHPEKMPLLSQPLSFNTCMDGGHKKPLKQRNSPAWPHRSFKGCEKIKCYMNNIQESQTQPLLVLNAMMMMIWKTLHQESDRRDLDLTRGFKLGDVLHSNPI